MRHIQITSEKDLRNAIKQFPNFTNKSYICFSFDMDEFLIEDKLLLETSKEDANKKSLNTFKFYDETKTLRVLVQVNEDNTISLRDYHDEDEDSLGYVYLD